jgi:phosphoserine phosphatase
MTDLVATLIARPEDASNLAAVAATLTAFLDDARAVELSPGAAVDLFFDGTKSLTELRERLRREIADVPVDVVVQPVAGRRKKLLVADMDSTIIGQECIDELADFVGLKPEVAAITERAMRGEIEFEPALRERVALLKGLPSATIGRVIVERIRLTPGAAALVATMRANGAHTILVSGGFTAFVEPVAAMVGFDESRANLLHEKDGRLTGEVAEPILGRTAKLAALEEAILRLGIRADETLAVGDGANDLAMLSRAGLGVGFHAKPKVAEAADVRIDHADLTALLFAQGYRREEFRGAGGEPTRS